MSTVFSLEKKRVTIGLRNQFAGFRIKEPAKGNFLRSQMAESKKKEHQYKTRKRGVQKDA